MPICCWTENPLKWGIGTLIRFQSDDDKSSLYTIITSDKDFISWFELW